MTFSDLHNPELSMLWRNAKNRKGAKPKMTELSAEAFKAMSPMKRLRYLTSDPYELIAGAIVIKYADRYRTVLKNLNKRRNSNYWQRELNEVEEFFRSDSFRILTDLDPEMLMRRIRDEIQKSC